MAEEKNTIPSSQWNQEEENQLKLADIWAMFWNNRIWYIISVVLCVLVAVFYIYHTPKTFSRTAKVIVDGVKKTSNRGYSSFYPEDMSPQEVVDAINQAYDNRELIGDGLYAGLCDAGFEIDMALTDDGRIITAYPVMED